MNARGKAGRDRRMVEWQRDVEGNVSERRGRLQGRVTIVTGSGGGMGGAIAVRLAQEGADIVLNDRAAERAGRCEEDIRRLGRDVVTVVASVTRRKGRTPSSRRPWTGGIVSTYS